MTEITKLVCRQLGDRSLVFSLFLCYGRLPIFKGIDACPFVSGKLYDGVPLQEAAVPAIDFEKAGEKKVMDAFVEKV